MNQHGAVIGGSTLKEQLTALAQKSENKDLNLDIPVGSAGSSFNFDGLATKIQKAIAEKSDGSTANSQDTESSASYLEKKAKDLVQQYTAKNPQLKL